MSFKIFVVVIPNEGLAGRAPTTHFNLLGGPTRQSFFWYDKNKDLRRRVFAAHALTYHVCWLDLAGSHIAPF